MTSPTSHATRKALACALSAAWLLIAAVVPAGSTTLSQALWHQAPPISERLGLAFPDDDPSQYWRIADMGLGVVRVSAAWGRIEQTRGVYDFSGLDFRILALGRLGITTFLTFESDNPELAELTNRVRNGVPRSPESWSSFVQAVTERYDGDGVNDAPGLMTPLRFVQVANEFLDPTNRSGGWAGTQQALLAYINAAYTAAKSAHPDVIFVLGGVASFNIDAILIDAGRANFELRQDWSKSKSTIVTASDLSAPRWRAMIDQRFYPVLRAARYDVADVHLYGPETRDVERLSFLAQLTGRPVLSSECGGPSTDYGIAYTGHRHFGVVLERNLTVLSSGASFCLWFGLSEAITSTYSNRKTPLFDKNLVEKPGVDAYRLLASLLSDMGEVSSPSTRLFTIDSREGPICVAFDVLAKREMARECGNQITALCIIDAARKHSEPVSALAASQDCPDDGIALGGPGLAYLLLRNLRQ